MKRKTSRTRAGVAALFLALPAVAFAQFTVDADRQTLRGAMARTAVEDLSEGESALVAGPLPACVRERTLFIDAARLTAEEAAAGENFRVRRLPENAVEIETVTTSESLYPRLKMALGLALSGGSTECNRLSLPEERLFRVAAIDGAADAAGLLDRAGALDGEPEAASETPPPAALDETAQPAEPPGGWRFHEEAAKDGVDVALVATLAPRSPSLAEHDDVSPRLKMRCESGVTSFSIASEVIVWDERPEVTLRIGDGKVSTYRWRASEDGKAVGLWSAEEAIPFLRRLPDDTALFVRLRDRNLIYVEFDLANAGEAVDRLKRACGW